jgi:transglutaminase-like putative cysteine protease
MAPSGRNEGRGQAVVAPLRFDEMIAQMKLLTVRHATTYRYDAPVIFGQHRLMLRPRDSHDLRLVGAELRLSPPGKVLWLHDVFSNSVALVDFEEPADSLTIVSTLSIERYPNRRLDFPISPEAENYPFMHSANERSDLGRLRERHYPDRGETEGWARQFILEQPTNTFNLLARMNGAMRGSFKYNAREEEGTQAPHETLATRSGTCRDYALLFIEAARSLGFGARFVSGYLYDPALDGGAAVQGAGATHAWTEIYLPGAGWVEFDPTNGSIAGENLIRVAVTRDPAQASPIGGTFSGAADYLGMEVDVIVRAEAR